MLIFDSSLVVGAYILIALTSAGVLLAVALPLALIVRFAEDHRTPH
jgi:hypothetical protein